MIPQYSTTSTMFKDFNANSFYKDPFNGKERRSIFGNSIPQVAKAQPDPKSSACCVTEAGGQMPSGGFKMNSFYSTIWKRNLRNMFSSVMAFGEECCSN